MTRSAFAFLCRSVFPRRAVSGRRRADDSCRRAERRSDFSRFFASFRENVYFYLRI